MGYNDNKNFWKGASGGFSKHTAPADLPKIVFFEESDVKKEKIRQAVVDDDAQKCAQAFITPSFGKKINSSQLRKFYAEAKSLELAWNTQGKANFGNLLPRIKLLKAKAAYAKERGVVPDDFRKWLWNCVDNIKDGRDFEAFLLHFEAVVGFAYGLGLKD